MFVASCAIPVRTIYADELLIFCENYLKLGLTYHIVLCIVFIYDLVAKMAE